MSNDWKEYEAEIMEMLKDEYPEAQITANQLRHGRYSDTLRQVDILIEGQIAGSRFVIVVDAKFYSRKVDVKGVDAFISMVHDIGAHKGLIITKKGYSNAAISRAFNDPHDIELDILNFEELHRYQGFCGIPYAGTLGAVIKAPFGWIIDATQYQKPSAPAHLYQRGSDLADALRRGELLYVQFWDRKKDGFDIDALCRNQDKKIRTSFSEAKITYMATISRNDAETRLREAIIPQYVDVREYTGFVQFADFIFFAVLLTPHNVAKRNVRKLESVMLSALPLKVNDQSRKGEAGQN